MVSRVVCIRHGKPKTEGYAEDALRPLSDEGKTVQKKVTQTLSDKGIKPDIILTSPLLRARETADIISNTFGVDYENEEALGQDFDVTKLVSKIPPPESGQTLFLIGHAPTLADFVNRLAGQNVLPEGLSKSAAAVLEFSDDAALGTGKLVEHIKP